MKLVIDLMERGLLPDILIRYGIRQLNRMRLRQEHKGDPFSQLKAKMDFVNMLRSDAVAVETDTANRQHYEVPPEFFQKILGDNMKYSCCLWTKNTLTLTQAEEASLELVLERANIENGMKVLDLGCGWGSFSMHLAQKFPNCKVVSVSNSNSQRKFIQTRCQKHGIKNIEVITADVNTFKPNITFDRIVSIEMFEHMRNYQVSLSRIAQWLNCNGKLFVHIFTHKEYAYLFEAKEEDDWMGKYFFTAGMMPSDDLLLYFQHDLKLENHWRLSGTHYQKTAESWLSNMDNEKTEILSEFKFIYGEPEAQRWFQRWRIFFMACSELWGYRNGKEWFISHYLFRK